MNNHSILDALAQLEHDLKDIQSAKEQIDDVLEADSLINESLAGYVSQLASFTKQVELLKDNLKSTINEILSLTDGEATKCLSSINKQIGEVRSLLSTIDDKVKQHASSLTHTLDESCAEVISRFQKQLDSELSAIQQVAQQMEQFETKLANQAARQEQQLRAIQASADTNRKFLLVACILIVIDVILHFVWCRLMTPFRLSYILLTRILDSKMRRERVEKLFDRSNYQ